jgi:hypothetical protein
VEKTLFESLKQVSKHIAAYYSENFPKNSTSKNLKKVSGNILEKISGNFRKFRKFPEILHKTNGPN